MMDLWPPCRETIQIASLGGDLLRMVESQQQIATTSLVDDLAEQALLEELIERSKPPLRAGTERLHYLLATPFRYPPLRHGSRFGTRFEPSLLYGARGLPTLLAEVAYYRFLFWTGMNVPPPSRRLLTQHTLFRARWRSERGVRLHAPPCNAYETQLRHPSDYGATQRLGRALREIGVGAFEFVSARDPARGINVALFEPEALISRTPLAVRAWLCETRADRIVFAAEDEPELHVLDFDLFAVDGKLPLPAG
jgi:hypothetical protein